MKRRTFSKEKKLEILEYAREHGNMEACRRYGLAQSVFYRWRDKYLSTGAEGLDDRYKPKQDRRIRELEGENARLKKIIAEQALELDLAKEVIKKKYQQNWK